MNVISFMFSYLIVFPFIGLFLFFKLYNKVDDWLNTDDNDEVYVIDKKRYYDYNNPDMYRPKDLLEKSKRKDIDLYYKRAKNKKQKNNLDVEKESKNNEGNLKGNALLKKSSKTTYIQDNKKTVRRVDPNPELVTEMWIDDNIKQLNKILYELLGNKFILIEETVLPEWKSSWSNIAHKITEIYGENCEKVNLSYEILDQGILLKKI